MDLERDFGEYLKEINVSVDQLKTMNVRDIAVALRVSVKQAEDIHSKLSTSRQLRVDDEKTLLHVFLQ